MLKFQEFLTKKDREGRKHLRLIKKLFDSQGFKVKAFLDGDEPYLYLYSTKEDLSFDGIRIYILGTKSFFRVAKHEDKEPYGSAYSLDLEKMFEDQMLDHGKSEKAVKNVVEEARDEIQRFFKKSVNAEKYLRSRDYQRASAIDPIVIRGTGTDYSNLAGSTTY